MVTYPRSWVQEGGDKMFMEGMTSGTTQAVKNSMAL